MMGNYCVGYEFCGVTGLGGGSGCGECGFSKAKDQVGIECLL